ncbi:MAG: FAD-dependent oxidoreductase [Rhodospirillaceae bacterium]|nr:FAD-dependent oxidoreductase [Rhodospirillaceae bacterium]
MKSILVIGGGFAGLSAALNAVSEIERHGGDITVTLVSESPYITIRPRLYEPSPETLREPLLPILEPTGIDFIQGFVRTIDAQNHLVGIEQANGETIECTYDQLILATGSGLRPPDIPGNAEHSFNIDTFDAAMAFDNHLRDIVKSPEQPGHDTFVVVGAGLTGIELATELRTRIAIHADSGTADRINVILIERSNQIGKSFGTEPQSIIAEAINAARIDVRTNVSATKIDPRSISLSDGSTIETATTVLTTGMRASPLTEQITGERDNLGRLIVDDMLRVQSVDNVFAAGDVARALVDDHQFAMMSCQHGRTMGKYAGFNASHALMELELKPYRQPSYVTCLDLGQSGAVFTTGWDRQVESSGEDAKNRKRLINTELIYPPKGDRAEILAAMRIDEKTGR